MGPADGRSEILVSRKMTSPLFAALVNAAASHISEQDDVHNGSVFHPAAVVFPAALATAQHLGASGRDFIAASVAGYEVGIRVGEFLGRSHYRVFHTTGTAGTIAAAVAVGRLLGLDEAAMLHAIGSAGTQAAGLWEFLRDAADSKQLHTAKAAADGLTAAFLASDGFTGAKRILEGEQGMAAGMSSDADPAKLTDRLGSRWAVLETSFKFHASCRHTHPAADALLQVRGGERSRGWKHRPRRRPCASGRDRRARSGDRSGHRPSGEILDAGDARPDRRAPARRHGRVRRLPGGRAGAVLPRPRRDEARSGSRRRLSRTAGSARSR